MAWQYVGTTSGASTSTGYTVSLSGTLTGGIASSPATGDLVVVFSGFANNASSAPAVSGNTTGAYTGATAAQHQNDTWDSEFRSFYAVMGGTPDTTLTVTRVTNAVYGGATTVHVWRGVDTSNPFIGAGTSTGAGNTSLINPPAYNPGVTNALIIAGGIGTQATTGAAFTGFTGMSNFVTRKGDGTTCDADIAMASYAYAGVSYDPPVVSGGTGGNASSSWAGVTIAFRMLPPLDVTITPTGNVAFSGSTSFRLERAQVPTGTVVFSGSSALVRERFSSTSGTVEYSGTAALTFVPAPTSATYTIVPTGSIDFSGTLVFAQEKVFPTTGTLSFTGTNGFTREHVYFLSGGMEFSGAVSNNYTRALAPTGSIYFSGTAPIDGPAPPASLFSSWRSLTGSGL